MFASSIISHKFPFDTNFEIEFIRVKKAIQLLVENSAQTYDSTPSQYQVETENYDQSLSPLSQSTTTATTPLSDSEYNSINQNQNYETTQQSHQPHNISNSTPLQSQHNTNSAQVYNNSNSDFGAPRLLLQNFGNGLANNIELSEYSSDDSVNEYTISVRRPVETLPSQEWNSIEEMNNSVFSAIAESRIKEGNMIRRSYSNRWSRRASIPDSFKISSQQQTIYRQPRQPQLSSQGLVFEDEYDFEISSDHKNEDLETQNGNFSLYRKKEDDSESDEEDNETYNDELTEQDEFLETFMDESYYSDTDDLCSDIIYNPVDQVEDDADMLSDDESVSDVESLFDEPDCEPSYLVSQESQVSESNSFLLEDQLNQERYFYDFSTIASSPFLRNSQPYLAGFFPEHIYTQPQIFVGPPTAPIHYHLKDGKIHFQDLGCLLLGFNQFGRPIFGLEDNEYISSAMVYAFATMLYECINSPYRHILTTHIQLGLLTPYHFVCALGRQHIFQDYLRCVQWHEFDRIFPVHQYRFVLSTFYHENTYENAISMQALEQFL